MLCFKGEIEKIIHKCVHFHIEQTNLKVLPELPLRDEYRLVSAVVEEHERDERDHDLNEIEACNKNEE